jgi:predicted dehydrogenase
MVGCGAIAERFYAPALSALASLDRLSVSFLVDPDPRQLSVLGNYFPSAAQNGSVEAIKANEVDLAVVASPQRYHAEQTITLLEKGVHVLCEKPLASNLAEAEAMVRTATENRRLLAVGLFRRFLPTTQFVREMILGQDLGKPVCFHWSEGGVFDWPAATPSFFQKASSPGGVFSDLGAHVVDLLLFWFGAAADFDYRDDAMGGLEANADLHLRFESGVTGKVRLSRDTPIQNSIWIEFERGTLAFQGGAAGEVELHFEHCDFIAKAQLHHPAKGSKEVPEAGRGAQNYTQSFMEQIRNVCRAIRGQEPLRVPGTEALPSMALIEQCYAQRRLMQMPWLSAREQDGAEALAR